MENYFAFYDLEPHFNIDEKALRIEYLRLSKENHPDFYVNDDARHAEALELTSINNKAYNTLNKPDKRLKHLLELKGGLKESKNDIPQEFLMEMMDINEALMELQMDFDGNRFNAVKKEVDGLESEMANMLISVGQEHDNKIDKGEDATKELQQLLEIYLKQKYLLRIKETLSKFAAL